MTEPTDQTAEQIAARGRDALIARLRPAFEEAAAVHADVLQLGPDQIETMVQRAADRADGLQWRRALAAVATEELGISLGEALSHPAVARAHELVGAPSYEESLASLGPAPARTGRAARAPEPEAVAEPDAGEPEAAATEPHAEAEAEAAAPEQEPESAAPAAPEATEAEAPGAEAAESAVAEATVAEPEAAVAEPEPAVADPELAEPAEPEPEPEPAEPEPEPAEPDAAEPEPKPDEGEDEAPDEVNGTADYGVGAFADSYDDEGLRMAVIHLGGIANLEPSERNIELLMSAEGLDIIRAKNDVLGRLEWDQVKALEVPPPRSKRRMRKPGPTHLVIRTLRGDASFEVPEVSPGELRQHLAPVIAEHVRRS